MKKFKVGDWVTLHSEGVQTGHMRELPHGEVFRITEMRSDRSFLLFGEKDVLFWDWAFDNLGHNLSRLEAVIYGFDESEIKR